MNSFLNDLELSETARETLLALGASSALALLCMRKASPIAFDANLGEHAQDIANVLFASMSDEDKTFLLTEPAPPSFPLGAMLEPREPKE